MALTSYGYPGGIGNRTALIEITDPDHPGVGSNLVDGDLSPAGSISYIDRPAGQRLIFDFSALGPRIIDELTLYKNSLDWGTVQVRGSEDGYEWVELGVPFATNGETTIVHGFANETPYTYYDLLHTVTQVGTCLVKEVDFKLSPACPPHARTSYTFPGGVGDRSLLITVGGTASWGGAGDPQLIVNGNVASDNVWLNSGQSGVTIEFDFSAIGVQRITAFSWWQSGAASQGGWVFEAYDPDLYAWVELKPEFDLGGSAAREDHVVDNEGYYELYRLRNVSGVTTNGPFVYEIEFEIGGQEAASAPEIFSYANSGGTGDRSALIAVTADFAPFLGGVGNLVDGGFGADAIDAFGANPAGPGNEIIFDLTAMGGQAISEFRFFRNDADDDWGDWQFGGSQDGDYWDDLGEVVKLGGTSRRYHEVCNQSVYNYYRLLHVDGVLSGNPWLIEIEFRLSGSPPPDIIAPHRVENESAFGALELFLSGLRPGTVVNQTQFGAPTIVEGEKTYVVTTIILT